MDNTRQPILESALSTEEGMEVLSNAMVEPIRISPEYQAIGRRLLMVTEMPLGLYESYMMNLDLESSRYDQNHKVHSQMHLGGAYATINIIRKECST